MNISLRTLPLPGAVRPVREHGSSALDRAVIAWPAPQAEARVLDRWGMPPRPAAEPLAWSAPDPVMRFDLPAPDLGRAVEPTDARADLIEPRYTVTVPDLHSVSRAAVGQSDESSRIHDWPAPTFATAAAPVAVAEPKRRRISTRAAVGLATAAGALAAGAAVFIALF